MKSRTLAVIAAILMLPLAIQPAMAEKRIRIATISATSTTSRK